MPICFLTTPLGEYLASATQNDPVLAIAVQPVYTVMSDFRSIILRRSALGKEVLDLYGAHAERAAAIVAQHPHLLSRWLTLLARGVVLAQDILRAYSYGARHVATGALKLDSTTADNLVTFIREFREAAPKQDFDQVLARVEEIVHGFVGLTAREVLQALAVDEAA